MLILFTDTDTDTTLEIAAEYGYHLISMPYSIGTETVYPYEDFDVFDAHTYYDRLRGGVIPNTSAISPEMYRRYFEPIFERGDDIFYVHFSSAMSMTFGNMKVAVDDLLKKYPERKFYSVDTKGISVLCLSVVRLVGELYKEGRPAEEILTLAEEETEHRALYFFADDLRFFKHSGRVSGLAATMGSLLGVRPIIYVNDEGKMVSIGKEIGRARAIDRLLQYVRDLGENVRDHRVLIGHTDAPEIAEEIAARLKEEYGADLSVTVSPVNPTIGAHCGPNGVGICFRAKHR